MSLCHHSTMARRKTATVSKTKDVVVVTPAAPVTRRRRSSSAVSRRQRPRRRRSSSVGGQASYKNRLIGTAIGGLGYGLIEKNFGSKIPSLPFLGRSGTVAAACYFFGKGNKHIQDVGIAAAAIAGYSYGGTGKVSGEDDYDDDD